MEKKFLPILLMLFVTAVVRAQSIGFTQGPDMTLARMGTQVHVAADGKVYVFGGHGTGFVRLNTADVYNPLTNSFSLLQLSDYRDASGIIHLSDGRVMLIGGMSSDLGVGQLNTTEIINPSTGGVQSSFVLNDSRTMANGVELTGGGILVMGNWWGDVPASRGEYYNGSSVTLTQGTNQNRAFPVMVPCTDGKALIFGGWGVFGGNFSGKVEIFDPQTNSFTLVRDNLFADDPDYYVTAVYGDDYQHNRLPNGKYIFLAKQLTGNQAKLFTVDPATKEIAYYNLSQPLPPYDSTLQAAYAYYSPMVDAASGYMFIPQVVYNGAGYNFNVLMADTRTAPPSLYIPPQPVPFSYFPMNGARVLMNNFRLLLAGGNISDNFTPVKQTAFIQLTVPTGVDDGEEIAADYSLEQNYPNPFNPSTGISFSLPEASVISLKVYDAAGELKATLAEGAYSAGKHFVNFNGEKLASGIYFYTLRTEKNTISKKMSLIK